MVNNQLGSVFTATSAAAFAAMIPILVSFFHPGVKRASFGLAKCFKRVSIGAMSNTTELILLVTHFTSGNGLNDTIFRSAKSTASPAHFLHHLMAFVGGIQLFRSTRRCTAATKTFKRCLRWSRTSPMRNRTWTAFC